MKPKPHLPGELALIARYFAPLAKGFPGAYGLLDDAAVISPAPGNELFAKTDAIVGGVDRLGLGTCCIGFARPWLNLGDTKSQLGIPEPYVPIAPIVVGYPRSAAPRVPRKLPEIHRLGSKG